MSVSQPTLSVIIPVYNEAATIAEVIRDLDSKIIKKIPHSVLMVSEDGSTDGTREILSQLRSEIPFEFIGLSERKGYTKTFKDALRLAKSDLVFFSDSDGQHDPSDIFKLLNEIEKFDIVSGCKTPRRDPFFRVFVSNIYNFLIYVLFGLKMKDIDSGFKLIKKEVIARVLDKVTVMKYCVMSEFILRAFLAGYKIKEVSVSHFPRKAGTSSIFHPFKIPKIAFGLIKNLFEIKSQARQGAA